VSSPPSTVVTSPAPRRYCAHFRTTRPGPCGFRLPIELALSLVRAQTGQSMDDLVQELTLHMAAAAMAPPPDSHAA
jgi:hypothetical protein